MFVHTSIKLWTTQKDILKVIYDIHINIEVDVVNLMQQNLWTLFLCVRHVELLLKLENIHYLDFTWIDRNDESSAY